MNSIVKIEYYLPYEGIVSLELYDKLGKKISTLLEEKKSKGLFLYSLDKSGLETGVYFVNLILDNGSNTVKRTVKVFYQH